MPPALFFLKIVLAAWGFLCFNTNFWTIFSLSVKNAIGAFIGISLNLWIALGIMDILAVLILPIHEHGYVSTYLCLLQFSSSMS